jgi:hypothetical protein
MTELVIYSKLAGETWQGTIGGEDEPDLELIFRAFNRVDEGDAERLEAIGYRLPSLSVGDIVGTGDKWFRCESAGWSEISHAEAARAWALRGDR